LEQVIGLAKVNTGIITIVGQVLEGIADVAVGVGVDRARICAKYGSRKSWHLLGTAMITLTFPFVFCPPIGYDRVENKWTDMQMVRFYLIPDFNLEKTVLLNGSPIVDLGLGSKLWVEPRPVELRVEFRFRSKIVFLIIIRKTHKLFILVSPLLGIFSLTKNIEHIFSAAVSRSLDNQQNGNTEAVRNFDY